MEFNVDGRVSILFTVVKLIFSPTKCTTHNEEFFNACFENISPESYLLSSLSRSCLQLIVSNTFLWNIIPFIISLMVNTCNWIISDKAVTYPLPPVIRSLSLKSVRQWLMWHHVVISCLSERRLYSDKHWWEFTLPPRAGCDTSSVDTVVFCHSFSPSN